MKSDNTIPISLSLCGTYSIILSSLYILILFCPPSFVNGQQTGFAFSAEGVATGSNGLTTAKGIDQNNNIMYFGHTSGITKWNPTSMTVAGSVTNINGVSAVGIGINSATRTGYVCSANRKIWSFSLDETTTTNPVVRYVSIPPGNTPNPGDFSFCLFDFEKASVYIGKTTMSVERIDIESGFNWNGNRVQTSSRTFPSAPVAAVSTADAIFFALEDTRIVKFNRHDPNLPTAEQADVQIGSGAFSCIAADESRGFLFVGSRFGLGLKLKMSDLSLDNFMFVPNMQITSMTVDAEAGVLYVGTYNPGGTTASLVRVNIDTFAPVQTITNVKNSVLSGLLLGDFAYFASTNAGGTPTITRTTFSSCAQYETCDECLNIDPYYCGWCPGDTSFSCTKSRDCQNPKNGLTWSNLKNGCPTISQFTPSSGSIVGGTILNITLDRSKIGFPSSDRLRCAFWDSQDSKSVAPATFLEQFSVSCVTPERNNADEVTVAVEFYEDTYTSNDESYSYYDCGDATSCTECIDSVKNKPECGWCISSGSCTSQCNDNLFIRNSCPALYSVFPKSAPLKGANTVTITGSNFIPGVYQCRYGSALVPAKIEQSNTITCSAPTATVPGNVTLDVIINNYKYTEESLSFLYFDCSSSEGCADCIGSLKPDCGYCFDTGTCLSISTGSCASSPATTCPALLTLNPSSALVPNRPIVSIVGGTFPPSSGYSCLFENVTVPATRVNETTITCQAPSFGPGVVRVSLYHLNHKFSEDSLNFLYYDCSGMACFRCTGPDRSGCEWCLEENKCGASPFTCTTGSQVQTCPNITAVTPTSGSVLGGTTVEVSGTNFIPSTDYKCVFGSTAVPATRVSSTKLTCVTPAGLPEGVTTFSITYFDVVYAEDFTTFFFYDCLKLTACAECSALSECAWCLNTASCTNSTGCTAGETAQVCPELTSLAPNYCRPEGGSNITVTGSGIVPLGSYKCSFGAVTVNAEVLNASTLLCTCPPFPVGTVDFTVVRDSVQYFPTTLPFIYYDCLSNWTDCETCAPNPICGWCFTSQTCVEKEKCGSDSWADDKCPNIVEVLPDHTSLGGGAPVQINGTGFLKGLQTEVKFILGGSQQYVLATVESDTLMTCRSPGNWSLPAGNRIGTGSMEIYYRIQNTTKRQSQDFERVKLSNSTAIFRFVDCSNLDGCEKCNQQELCGWCIRDMSCKPNKECPASWTGTLCSEIMDIQPPFGSHNGGTKITISGRLFTDYGIVAKFGSGKGAVVVPTVFLDEKTLTAVTPSGDDESTTFDLYLNDIKYTAGPSRKWSYTDLSSLNVPLVVGLVVVIGTLAIIGIILAAFLIRRRRKQRVYEFELEEPNFAAIIFADEGETAYDVSKKKSHDLELLEKYLVEESHMPFVHLICDVAQATESEPVARSLIFIFADHKLAIAIIKSFIHTEVTHADSDTSIFRAQSVASKMFKYYSKLTGLHYIWKTLAVFTTEIGLSDQISESSVTSNNRLINPAIEIEIDPNKLDNPDDEQINKLQLLLTTQKIFNAIMGSVEDLPMELRILCAYIFHQVKERFPGHEYKALGSFLFLRFLCPSITAPHAYGLMKDTPSDPVQRKLILISKILQNLANGILFGKKEDFMIKMNEFIEANTGKLNKFYDAVVNIDPSIETTKTEHDIPKEVKDNSLAFLYHHITNKIAKINTELEKDENGQKTKEEVADMMEVIGQPPPRKV